MLKNKVLKIVAIAIVVSTLCSGIASAAFDFNTIGQYVVNSISSVLATATDADIATATDADVATATDADIATATDADVATATDADVATSTDADAEEEEEETCIFKKFGCIICKILMFIFDLLDF